MQEKVKILAINGGPRKSMNTITMLNHFIDGIHSINEYVEVKTIHLYDYKYTGCKGCFLCKLKTKEPGQCYVKDDIHNLLIEAKEMDGIIFTSPIYFCDLTAQLRGFLERLLYPGVIKRNMETAMIYTMNVKEEHMKMAGFDKGLDIIENYISNNLNTKPERIFAYNTYQFKNYDLYRTSHNEQEKAEWRDAHFQDDCQSSFDAGVRMIKRIEENR